MPDAIYADDLLEEHIHELQGSMLAVECFFNALVQALPAEAKTALQAYYAAETAAFRAALMNSTAPEASVSGFERDVQRALRVIGEPANDGAGMGELAADD